MAFKERSLLPPQIHECASRGATVVAAGDGCSCGATYGTGGLGLGLGLGRGVRGVVMRLMMRERTDGRRVGGAWNVGAVD